MFRSPSVQMLTSNRIWKNRTVDIGVVTAEDALNYGFRYIKLMNVKTSLLSYSFRKPQFVWSIENELIFLLLLPVEWCCEALASNGTWGSLSHMTSMMRWSLTSLLESEETATTGMGSILAVVYCFGFLIYFISEHLTLFPSLIACFGWESTRF